MDTNNKAPKNKPMTDEERLELAKELDKKVDDFVNGLERKPYVDGCPQERWEEDLVKHPFFLKEGLTSGEELHPLYQGLQQLKYDPDENTPLELAIAYKEDGNFNYVHKNYRLAVYSYTEGINFKCGDKDTEAKLYNNRATAHFQLKNFRSCLQDCEACLQRQPDYLKAQVHAAQCCFQLGLHDKCLEYCTAILEKGERSDILGLRRKCQQVQREYELHELKKKKMLQHRDRKEAALWKAINKRGINIRLQGHDPLYLDEQIEECKKQKVFLHPSGVLVWHVLMHFPQDRITEYMCNQAETVTLGEILKYWFSQGEIGFDKEGKYKMDTINVYYENVATQRVYKVPFETILGDMIKSKTFLVCYGTPAIIIFEKGSEAEKKFLSDSQF